ncbi:MAG: septum formation initiator family protein [Acidobacteriota bacterium]
MRLPEGRPFLKRLMLSLTAVLLLLLVGHAILGKRGYLEVRRIEDRNEELRQKIQQLQSENRDLLAEIHSLKTDPRTIEKIAREELGLVKPGEVKITPQNPRSTPAPGHSP